MSGMLEFWAKSGREGDPAPMHSVAHHGLDVAACASVLLDICTPPIPVPHAALVALIALHDIGKFTRTFQGKVEALWPPSLGRYQQRAGPPHDDCGFALLWAHLADDLDFLFDGWDGRSERAPLLRAVAGHHGRPPAMQHGRALDRRVACAVCTAAAHTFVIAVREVIAPPPLPPRPETEIARLAWWLAGLTTLADWVGSGRRWFPPVDAVAHSDLAAYWRDAQDRAVRAVRQSGLLPAAISEANGMRTLFPQIAPRPLQDWADSVELPDGPALFVIEDATGAGKTEAALVLAHRLLAAGRGAGLYFALPTMATANAMYDRLAPAYERLFAPGGIPSLVLAHGRRMLNPRFADSILDDAAEPGLAAEEDAAGQPAGAQCAAWIADDRRKAFLAQIGVGTIDQALLAVLPARHCALRLLGLAQRVLIVDEAHAYDTYMTAELKRLLQFHAALGGSAIVLSATLTAVQRAALSAAFRAGLRAPPDATADMEYPLATIVAADRVRAEPIAPAIRRRVEVARLGTVEHAADMLAAAATAGAGVAWVRNTVDDAIAAAALLHARGLDPILFHARFAMGDRLAIERGVLCRFGKDAKVAARRGRVLVATQVVEQSLDLDFDLMVTDLAPADLVIQRAGRVWRHERGPRPVPGPRILLLSPEPVDDPPADWLGAALRGTGAVYRDTAMLWRSARALLDAGAIETPENVRALVEAAFDATAPGAEPVAFANATGRAEAGRLTASAIGEQNVLVFGEPYCREAGLWEPDVRTPTRLGDQQLTLRLARLADRRIAPWCDDPDPYRAWTLSEVSVRAARVSGPAPDAEAEALLLPIRAAWPRWDRETPVLALRPIGDLRWQGRVLDRSGGEKELTYAAETGVVFPP